MKNTKYGMRAMPLVLLLAAAAGQTQAQSSVTVYGRVVSGLEYATNVATAGGGSGSRLSGASNQWGTSMLGFNGSEELGGGLKAVFDLESGFGSTTGTLNGAGLFNRFAYVGLSSKSAGTVKLGNFLSISNDAWYLDPTGQQWLGSATLVKGRSWNGASNTIQYETPDLGAFSAKAQYSAGEKSGSTAANSKAGISLAYATPTLELRAIYDVAHDADGKYTDLYTTSKELTLGGTLKLDQLKLYATWQDLSAPDAVGGPDKAKHYWLGANYDLSPALTLIGAAYHVAPNRSAGSASMYVLGGNYNLSKRTLLYVTYGSIQNSANAAFSERYWEAHNAGQNQSVLYAGISHSF